MKKLLVILTSAAFVVIGISSQATLLMYEPFDYPVGERLGGSGTSPLGQTNSNGKQWITRSPASGGTYDPAKDIVITNGSLSYTGLAPSKGNAVRYGSTTGLDVLYTDAIALPTVITDGSVYWSALVHFHAAIPTVAAARTSYASLSAETADPTTDAGLGAFTASGTGNIPLPASAWIRYSGTAGYHLGAGKQNSDGLGTSASAPAWQSGAASFPNQQGNIPGTGQDWATIDSNTNQAYFIVMKYTFDPLSPGNTSPVSMWVNPVASTLGHDDGEALAGASDGSYYSATNAYTTAVIDTPRIQSFLLIAVAQSSSRTDKTIDVTVDELRVGTTWSDVTPVPPPPPPQIITIAGAGTTSVTVTWTNVQIGTNYVLQYSTNLSTTNWSSLAPVTAAGTTAFKTDNPPVGTGARFYRVLQQ